ncbi:apolipoprotein N-acyltransferase [Haloferula sp.]|uniref:apolipoprotein N-acyltransferase n=1 Tax=Haloferula sp. TaxID=2497595 RepID=UPI003C7099AA
MNLPTRLALTLASAILAIVSFPPLHWWWLALMAWLPFFLALRGAGPKTALLIGLLHGMLLFSGTLIWLVEIFGPMAFLLHFILAMFSVFFAMIFNTLDRPSNSAWLTGMLAGILWAGIEYFRSEWFTLRFPWITPGTALPPNLLTPLIGVYGISLLVILATAWLVSRNNKCRITGVVALIMIALAIAFNSSGDKYQDTSLQVSAIQGETLSFDEYMDLSASISKPTKAIIWPEYALSFDLREHPDKLARIRELMQEKEAEVLIVGSMTIHADNTWSNTAIIVGQDRILGTHNKNRPVHFFDDGEPGKEAPAWPTPIGKIATPICFDNDYAAVPRRAVANGAEMLLIPSMDAEHWTTRQHLQHAELFRHRAAENRRWMVVAASSGLTQIIDPSGNRRASLPLFEPGVLHGEIRPLSTLTFYTRFGWLLGPACALLAGLMALAAVVIQRRDAKRPTIPN